MPAPCSGAYDHSVTDNGQQPRGGMPAIQPAPLPFQLVTMAHPQDDGTKVAELRWFTPQGMTVLYMPEENARVLMRWLNETYTGIVLPDMRPNKRFMPPTN